jgi:hypothetical protein
VTDDFVALFSASIRAYAQSLGTFMTRSLDEAHLAKLVLVQARTTSLSLARWLPALSGKVFNSARTPDSFITFVSALVSVRCTPLCCAAERLGRMMSDPANPNDHGNVRKRRRSR